MRSGPDLNRTRDSGQTPRRPDCRSIRSRTSRASVAVDSSQQFVAGVAELGLDGVAAKRLDSTCARGNSAAPPALSGERKD